MASHSKFLIPVSDTISLSPLRPEDNTAFVQHLNDEEIYNNTLHIPYPYTEEDADRFLALDAEATKNHGHPIHFAIRDHEGKLIGGSGFEGLCYKHKAELGYWLAGTHWGNGIMTRVVKALCDFAFREWKLVRITAHVFTSNPGSAKVLQKNGFQLEGTLQKHYRKKGKLIDAWLYALLKESSQE